MKVVSNIGTQGTYCRTISSPGGVYTPSNGEIAVSTFRYAGDLVSSVVNVDTESEVITSSPDIMYSHLGFWPESVAWKKGGKVFHLNPVYHRKAECIINSYSEEKMPTLLRNNILTNDYTYKVLSEDWSYCGDYHGTGADIECSLQYYSGESLNVLFRYFHDKGSYNRRHIFEFHVWNPVVESIRKRTNQPDEATGRSAVYSATGQLYFLPHDLFDAFYAAFHADDINVISAVADQISHYMISNVSAVPLPLTSYDVWNISGQREIDVDSVVAILPQAFQDLHVYASSQSNRMTNNNLSFDALQNIGILQSNQINNFKELTEMAAQFKSTAATLKRLPSSKIKGAAQLFLSVHYGYKLTLMDIKELRDFLASRVYSFENRASTSFVWDSTSYYQGLTRFNIYYNTMSALENMLNEFLFSIDFKVDLSNIWDAIPWSFVVDWFVKVGDFLEAFDNFTNVQSHYNCNGCTRSDKASGIIPLDRYLPGVGGTLVLTEYLRTSAKFIPVPLPSKEQIIVSSPLRHWFEGAALFVANK